ncbi:RNA-binding protein 44 [Sphaeramia orbicularis]|uniref:RNA-binding protein 44 n=1 Tax=Sphaeramia orbicularis TaxID=375764 RepID=UPI00117ED8B3|nr:RNA-binding protein 44-like [Sphaeramia orbicularis]
MKCGEDTISSLNGDADSFHSIMHDDKSIVLLVAANSSQPNIRGGPSNEDASESGSPASCKTDQPLIQKTTAEKFTSPMPCIPTCDVMVGTELAICSSAFTQTQNPATADKHLITELHMSDLDYLAEEFIKLKTKREELQKGKMKCSGCKSRKKCDYVQRAQQAELSLLALQYRLCRQHYLKDQPPSVQKDTDHLGPESPPANIVSVLKMLESEYNQMREKIQAGIPLHDLKLLSVDCAQITGAYVPARTTDDMLGDSASGSSQQPQNNMSTDEPQCPHGENSKDCQDGQIHMNQLQEGISKMRGAVTLIPNERDPDHNTHKPNESQSATPFKDLSTSEAWYDAEEDLELAVAAETEQNTIMTSEHVTDEYGTGEKKMSSMLCVSGLPSNVSEVITQLPLTSSLKHRKVVSIPPMAEGTCVPQWDSTSVSFDILMAELTQHHPDVGKQQILDALLELWVKHQGVLSGMTLRSIRQMTSDILTRPVSTTQL